MATSVIKATKNPIVRLLEVPYLLASDSTFNTNLKTLIDADMPSGYHFGGLCGYASNNVQALTTNFGYYDSDYSLQLANRGNSRVLAKFRVFYIANPN